MGKLRDEVIEELNSAENFKKTSEIKDREVRALIKVLERKNVGSDNT